MLFCETLMTANPVTCRPTDTVAHAAGLMRMAGVGALPVVDGEEEWLVGFISDRDIMKRVAGRGLPSSTSVARVMTRDVVTCLPDHDVYEAIDRMEDRQLQRLPIIDEDGRLIGILTRDDLTTRVGALVTYDDLLEEVHAED